MFAGISVSKRVLELATTDEFQLLPPTAKNSPAGVATVIAALQTAAPQLIAIESTGLDCLPLLAWFVVAELPVVPIAPAPIDDFRQQRGASDNSTRIMARFAEEHHAELLPVTLSDEDRMELQQVVDHRDFRVASLAKARNWQLQVVTEETTVPSAMTGKLFAEDESQLREIDMVTTALLGIPPEAES